MKELIRVRVQYASRQQCCKTHKRPLPFTFKFCWTSRKKMGDIPLTVVGLGKKLGVGVGG